MRITVVGTGALASLFAARLAPLVQVTMTGTWAAQLAAIREKGLTLIEPDGRRQVVRFPVTDVPGEAHPADAALILVKSYQTERAARAAAQALAPDGFALTLQNGLGNLDTLAAVLGARRAVAGTTSEGATMVAPGIVRHAGWGVTHLGRAQSGGPAVAALAALFADAGFETHLTEDVEALLWGKLAVNAGINPLSALLGRSNGFLVESEPARLLMTQAASEVASLARVLQITLPYPDAGRRAAEVATATAANRSSMLQDVENGRPTELEMITGAVVRLAGEIKVPLPVNAALLHLLRHKLSGGNWREEVSELPSSLQTHFARLAAAPSTPRRS